jgi:hypothetical protein
MKNVTWDACIANPKTYEWLRTEDLTCTTWIKAVTYNCVEQWFTASEKVSNCWSLPVFLADETYVSTTADNFTVYASQTCTIPSGCFTLWSSTLGWTDTLCTN